jgi:hypothetical protein
MAVKETSDPRTALRYRRITGLIGFAGTPQVKRASVASQRSSELYGSGSRGGTAVATRPGRGQQNRGDAKETYPGDVSSEYAEEGWQEFYPRTRPSRPSMAARKPVEATRRPASINTHTRSTLFERFQQLPMLTRLLLFIGLVWLFWTILWGARLGVTHVGNHLRFGGQPHDSITMTISGEQGLILATNTPNKDNSAYSIDVTLFVNGTPVQALDTKLYQAEWGDTSNVVPEFFSSKGQLYLRLTGAPQYWGWLWPTPVAIYQINITPTGTIQMRPATAAA